MEGTQRYCGDIGVSVEDVTFFLLSEIVQSPAMGEMERDKFVDGWAQLKYVPSSCPCHTPWLRNACRMITY